MDSDNIPFETEIQHAEVDTVGSYLTSNCTKNPQHEDFILFKDLTTRHLGTYEDDQLLSYIQYMGGRAVRVRVHLPDGSTDSATGFICKRDQTAYVVTNSHVVNSKTKAENCIIDFDYETEDQERVVSACGTELRFNDNNRDYCQVYFDRYPVRHIIDPIVDLWDYTVLIRFPGSEEEERYYILMLDGEYVIQTTELKDLSSLPEEIIQVKFNDGTISQISEIYTSTDKYAFLKLNQVPQRLMDNRQAILPVLNPHGSKPIFTIAISHPHGNPKSVSFGIQLEEKNNMFQVYHSAMTCSGSSGAPVLRIGLHDIGKFPRTMLYTHCEGVRMHEYKGIAIPSSNLNKAVLNTRRINESTVN